MLFRILDALLFKISQTFTFHITFIKLIQKQEDLKSINKDCLSIITYSHIYYTIYLPIIFKKKMIRKIEGDVKQWKDWMDSYQKDFVQKLGYLESKLEILQSLQKRPKQKADVELENVFNSIVEKESEIINQLKQKKQTQSNDYKIMKGFLKCMNEFKQKVKADDPMDFKALGRVFQEMLEEDDERINEIVEKQVNELNEINNNQLKNNIKMILNNNSFTSTQMKEFEHIKNDISMSSIKREDENEEVLQPILKENNEKQKQDKQKEKEKLSFIQLLKYFFKIKEKQEEEGDYTPMHLEEEKSFRYDPVKKRYIIDGEEDKEEQKIEMPPMRQETEEVELKSEQQKSGVDLLMAAPKNSVLNRSRNRSTNQSFSQLLPNIQIQQDINYEGDYQCIEFIKQKKSVSDGSINKSVDFRKIKNNIQLVKQILKKQVQVEFVFNAYKIEEIIKTIDQFEFDLNIEPDVELNQPQIREQEIIQQYLESLISQNDNKLVNELKESNKLYQLELMKQRNQNINDIIMFKRKENELVSILQSVLSEDQDFKQQQVLLESFQQLSLEMHEQFQQVNKKYNQQFYSLLIKSQTAYQQQIYDMQQDINGLEQMKSEQQCELEQQQNDYFELKEIIQQQAKIFKEESELQIKQVEQLKNDIFVQLNQIKQLRAENNYKQSLIDDLTENLEEKNYELSKLENQCNDLQEQQKKERQQYLQLQEQHQDLHDQQKQLQEQYLQEVQIQNRKQDDLFSQLEEMRQKSEDQIRKNQNNLSSLRDQLKQENQDIVNQVKAENQMTLDQKITEYEQMIANLKEKYQQETELNKLKLKEQHQISQQEMEKNFQNMDQQLEQIQVQKQQEINQLNDEKQHLISQLEQSYLQKVEELQLQNQHQNEIQQQQQFNYEQQISQMNNLIKTKEDGYNQIIDEKQKEIESIQNKNIKTQKACEDMIEALKKQLNENHLLQIDRLMVELKQTYEKQVEQIKLQAKDELNQQIQINQTQLQQYEQQINDLKVYYEQSIDQQQNQNKFCQQQLEQQYQQDLQKKVGIINIEFEQSMDILKQQKEEEVQNEKIRIKELQNQLDYQQEMAKQLEGQISEYEMQKLAKEQEEENYRQEQEEEMEELLVSLFIFQSKIERQDKNVKRN